MPKKTKNRSIGAWAFLIGVFLALIFGVVTPFMATGSLSIVFALLLILGIIVGILNVAAEESSRFLLAALALVITSSLGGSAIAMSSSNLSVLGEMIKALLDALLVLFVPTTIIVALKSVFELAKD